MNDLFGLSMTYIMIALLVIVAISAATIGWIILRNRVMFFVGVRNIPRRRAQTVLIIVGLMLSTLIISTAFGIGDTVDYSITNQVYNRMHSIDEVVQAQSATETGQFDASAVIGAKPIPEGQATQYADAFRTIPGVDGAVSVIRGPVPVKDARSGQTEPLVVLVGIDGTSMEGFESDIATVDGREVPISALGPDDVYANASAADKLDIQKGDQIQVFTNNEPHFLTVREIVADRVLTGTVLGTPQGLVMGLARAQELFDRAGEVDMIAVSNEGGVRGTIKSAKAINDAIDVKLQGTSWRGVTAKSDAVDEASSVAAVFTTLFVVLGLFSIAAGMMLIFLIFVMLAAERKVEMGMMRAVGTKRSHLVQSFMSEGMVYNVGAAAVGCALGIAVSLLMVQVMAMLFSSFDLSIVFHVTARSLIVSYSLGVVLTFLTVTFSSWRIGSLNIVSAIRDAADPMPPRTRPEWRGDLGSLLSHAKWLVFKPTRLREWAASIGFLIVAPVLGVICAVMFMGAVTIYGSSGAASVVAVLLAVAGIGVGGLTAVAAGIGLNRIFQTGVLAMVVGAAFVGLGVATYQLGPFTIGVTLVALGSAMTLVMLRFPQRIVFTTMGVGLLVYWLLGAGGKLPPKMDAGSEMFFISGFAMVLCSTFVLVYNADLMLAVLTRLGSNFSGLIPAIRTAVAYPMANKFRTGMTIAMISLVMFALVMMTTMNSNFSRLFLGDEALGGYDIVISENPSNPIPDMTGALRAAGQDASAITREDDLKLANRRIAEVRLAPAQGETGDDYSKYGIVGASAEFTQGNTLGFQARAEGIATDADVWRVLREEPDTAIIDAFALPSGGFGPPGGFILEGVKANVTVFKPIQIEVRDSSDAATVRPLRIIGIISLKGSAVFNGLFLSPAAFDTIFPHPESTMHLLRLTPGTDSAAEAKSIEKALMAQGVQADSLRKLIDDQQAQTQGFMYLIDGFMGIGLFVGIAAVGVIAFRTVVERRQQIGMLRAIGFTRRAVATSFIMESSFITLLGVLSGVGLGLLLAQQLVTSSDFAPGTSVSFYIPWLEIGGIGTFAFVASLIMTIIPARQASGIPIAEALRYE